MKKLLLFLGAVAAMTACAESTTAPTAQRRAPAAASHDFTCRSGYAIAYDSNGNPYCVADSTQQQAQVQAQSTTKQP
ncbi:MAG TPA: hypothetical protein VHB25_17290 [Gemmatimonadaceae bacterium]|nr:hypothetical protein [Gemmatimonadaceae bacterium]